MDNVEATKALTTVTYPRTRLWSPDWTQLLWDSEKDTGTAEEWFAASEYDDLGISIDYDGSWRTRWGGRLVRHNDGSIDTYPASEFLKYMTQPPNPFVAGLGG
jgi:hypothetical protein